MNNNYENKFLDAMQILIDNAVSRAGYDKTIKAVVSKCVDESKGKYVVRYQDSSFYAYSNDLDAIYNGGTSVYVLIPGNDMSQTKTILGSVDRLGSDYITLSDSAAAYQEVGSSIIEENTNEFGVSSYKEHDNIHEDSIVLYDRTSDNNSLEIDTEGAQIYFQKATYMEIGGTFRTTLPEEQKRKGNYGLVFDIDFKDGETITNQKYVIDINSMTGNPYTYNYGSEQNVVYQIDGEHFYRLNSITLMCKNFPKSKTPAPNDIFIKDIILKALTPLTRDEIANNSLTFITKQGIYFNENDGNEASRLIETEVRINQKVIPNTDLLRFYWFKEDCTIGINSPDYLVYGGPGWKCINEYNIVDAETGTRDYLVNEDTLTVLKDSEEYPAKAQNHNTAKENEYKCVVIYNDSIQVERNFIIYNQASEYTVTIDSDQGTYFKFSAGENPTLTCNVVSDVTPAPTYDYTWMVTDSTNRTAVLEETTDLNTAYATAIARRHTLLTQKETGAWTEADETELTQLEVQIYNYDHNVQRVDGNKIYNVQLSKIVNFNKFTCCVSSDNIFRGKSDITITNSWNKEDSSYALIMENGDQIFKYNVNGISPTNKSLEKPIVIKPLQFSLFNEVGQQVDDNKISAVNVSWYVPKENTMITVNPPQGVTPVEEDGYLIYTTIKTLDFSIAPVYNNKKMNNTVKLVVKYDDRVITTTSELGFIKEGEVGSNGTDFVCRIVPFVVDNTQVPLYPMYTYNLRTSTGDMNYQPGALNKWFKVELYKDGVQIFPKADDVNKGTMSGQSEENKAVTLVWSILKNRYETNTVGNVSTPVDDVSSFSVDASTGEFSYTNLTDGELDRAANIVKVTVTYDGATYYATMPIILAKITETDVDNGYRIKLEDNTGFRYVMYTTDGLSPVYDSSNPFALRVYKRTDGTEADITKALASTDYHWYPIGKTWNGTTWTEEHNLITKVHGSFNPLAVNEKDYRPIEKFNGLSVNNALKCIVYENSAEVARIYLPIHLYLNRFGNSALNGWDGNHVEINNKGGFILAPQVGAGRKESDNSYTGVFMGTIKESGSSNEEIGLYGYNHGQRSIELNAQDGSAKFGAGKGRIILQPGENSAKLYSSNYVPRYVTPTSLGQTKYMGGYSYARLTGADTYTLLKAGTDYTVGTPIISGDYVWAGGEGLEIDLDDPHIRFGSGKFRVDNDGQVYATGFATVFELESGDYNIPGTENWKVINATEEVQFTTTASHIPSPTGTQQKSIVCQCSYKDTIIGTSDYEARFATSGGTVIGTTQTLDHISGAISQSGNDTTITFTVSSSDTITNATNTFYVKFVHNDSHLTVLKAFHVNLIILGANGAQGPQGPAGPKGNDGKDGKDGTSVTIIDSYPDEASLLAAFTPPDPSTAPSVGDGYIVDKDLYIYTGAGGGYGSDPDDWTDAGQIKGEDGTNGKDAKRCFIVATIETFKSTDGGSTYSPESSTIIPYLQAVNFGGWAYNIDGGDPTKDTPITGTDDPDGVAVDPTTHILTVDSDSEIFDTVDTVIFKCLTDDNNVYDTITLTRIKDGEDGDDGKSIVTDTTTTTYANSIQGNTPPSSGWNSTANPQPGEYTWTKIYTTYKFQGTSISAGSTTAYSVAYTAVDGTSAPMSYLTNETQSFVFGKANQTAETYLYGYLGSEEKTVQIKTVNGKAANTSDTWVYTQSDGLKFKVDSTSAKKHPKITFTTTADIPEDTANRISIVYRVTGENTDKTLYFSYSTTTDSKLYDIETNVTQVVKKVNDTYAPTSVVFYGYYKTGTRAIKTAYAGRWVIQTSVDGTNWTRVYLSGADESSASWPITTAADPKLIRAYLGPAGTSQESSIIANALDVQTIPVLNDSTDIEIGGRNLLKYTAYQAFSGVSAREDVEGTFEIKVDPTNAYNGNDSLKIDTGSTTPSYQHYDIWQYCWNNLEMNKPLRLTLWIKGPANSKAWFTIGGGSCSGGTTTGQFDVSTSWTKLDIDLGTVTAVAATGDQVKLIYGFNKPGTYYVNSMMLEYGNIASGWSPAPEDSQTITSIQYATTDTFDVNAIEADSWSDNYPPLTSKENKFIWKKEGVRVPNESIITWRDPECIWKPQATKVTTQYCLCTTDQYDENNIKKDIKNGAVVKTYGWADKAYEFLIRNPDGKLGGYITPKEGEDFNNIVINTYQFVRNVQQDAYNSDDPVRYTDPVLDMNWLNFGKYSYLSTKSNEILENKTRNSIIDITDGDGIYIRNPENDNQYIHLTSQGINFFNTNSTEVTALGIDGTLHTEFIKVNEVDAENVRSGKLELTDTIYDNGNRKEAAFVLKNEDKRNNIKRDVVVVNVDGIKVTNESQDVTALQSARDKGFTAWAYGSNNPYFETDPRAKSTKMENAQVKTSFTFDNAKFIKTTRGFSIINIGS